MSIKVKSLGTAVSAARGILLTAIGTGVPASVSITAGHRQRNGSRIAIVGAAADNGINGEWTLSGVAAGSAVLDGSNGSTALSGTAVVAAICDQTPFLPRHSVAAIIHAAPGAAATDGLATAVIEKADGLVAANFTYTNSSGVATSGFADALLSGEIAVPAFADFGAAVVEVSLAKYMTFRLSAWTSGSFGCSLLS